MNETIIYGPGFREAAYRAFAVREAILAWLYDFNVVYAPPPRDEDDNPMIVVQCDHEAPRSPE